MTGRYPASRLTLGLILACGVLVALAVWRAGGEAQVPGGEGGRSAAPRAEAPAGEAGPGYTPPPLESYSEITERPIFSPERKAPDGGQDALAAQGVGVSSTNLRLEGVALSPGERVAVIRRSDTQQLFRVSQGESLDAWRLETIRPDRVVLRSQGEVQVLMLPVERLEAQPAPAAPAPTAAAPGTRVALPKPAAEAPAGDGVEKPEDAPPENPFFGIPGVKFGAQK
jgi:hypothetical protein